jgi:BlaI family penicillinase repressor
MSRKHHLAELQMAIMQVLWDRDDATVAQVREALAQSRRLTCTTVGTMLTRLEQNGQVTFRSDGRGNIYRPSIAQEKVKRSMLTDLTQRLFSGSVPDLVCHLLNGCEVTREQLDELRDLIREKEEKPGGAG